MNFAIQLNNFPYAIYNFSKLYLDLKIIIYYLFIFVKKSHILKLRFSFL